MQSQGMICEGGAPVADTIGQSADGFYQALRSHPETSLVVLDFDETLWLRNSTESFLDSVRPRFLAAIVLQILGVLKPWRLFSNGKSSHYRDWIRVISVQIVAPWSLMLWRRNAKELGLRYANRPLLEAVLNKTDSQIAVVSFGFREIIEPLLAAISPHLPLRESCDFRNGAQLRKEGKASALERHVGKDALRQSLVITDSEVDTDLLHASGKPFLVRWGDAKYEQAGLKPLMPFVYLQRVKRPDENYLRNAIIGHDLPVLILSYALISTNPIVVSCAIILYVISFFSAYEIGYYENDKMGMLIEKSPKFPPNFHSLGKNFSPGFAWSFAILIAGLASTVIVYRESWIFTNSVNVLSTNLFTVWGIFIFYLVVMRLQFRWLNTIDTQGRIVPMLGLQVGRVLGYALIFPTTVIGALFCVAHGISKWIPYVVYRFGGSRREVPNHLNCLLLLTLFACAIIIGGNVESLINWQACLIFVYAGARGAKDLLAFAPKLLPVRLRAIAP